MDKHMDHYDDLSNRQKPSPLLFLLTLLLVIVLPLVLGLVFAPRLIPKPVIGVIRISYDIDGETAYIIGKQLEYARNDRSVKAVVLIINSPGGSAAYSEELFLDVLNTRAQMPVVASIDLLAASGAYYIAVGADEIFAKPSSTIGSIGVIALLPGETFIEEEFITTGPYKSFGGTNDSMMRQVEMAKFAFLNAVAAGRGEKLAVGNEVLARAEVYSGVQSTEMGLVDELASTEEAIGRAADLAGLAQYEVVDLFPLVFAEFLEGSTDEIYQAPVVDPQLLWSAPEDMPAGVYYRYYEPRH